MTGPAACIDCGVPRNRPDRAGARCRACANRSRPPRQTNRCTDCSTVVSHGALRCIPCNANVARKRPQVVQVVGAVDYRDSERHALGLNCDALHKRTVALFERVASREGQGVVAVACWLHGSLSAADAFGRTYGVAA